MSKRREKEMYLYFCKSRLTSAWNALDQIANYEVYEDEEIKADILEAQNHIKHTYQKVTEVVDNE